MTTTRTTRPPCAEATLTRAARHTAYSNPGPYGGLLTAVPSDPEGLSAVARNVIVHYRYSGHELPEATRADIHSRWLARTLELDQERHGTPLAVERAPRERVQGCCRDHSLFACAVLRQHGIPARGRIGFAGYFEEGYHHDHVVVEMWEESEAGGGHGREDRLHGGSSGRWRRFDPEVTETDGLVASPMDLPTGPGAPFLTAAEAWRGWRAGELDASRFGAGPGVGPEGPWFLQHYVLRELAHLQGDELLLWDAWGAMAEPGQPIEDAVLTLTDEVAALLVAADAEDLAERYIADERLHPGETVLRFDPFAGPGEPPTVAELTAYP
jgi:hypothetical protein